jgi:hypothetical protein
MHSCCTTLLHHFEGVAAQKVLEEFDAPAETGKCNSFLTM